MTDRGESKGRRPGRNTTHAAEVYESEPRIPRPQSRMEPDATGIAQDLGGLDGYQQPTAMFDRGEFLGELADDLAENVPGTRASVEAETPPSGFKLIIVAGPDLGMEWAFKQADVVIGRGADNQIDFSDIAVSRHHAKIALENTAFFLEDLGSNNGTLLNGVTIQKEQLYPGDEVVIGARTMRFVELNEAPETAAAHPIADPEPEPVAGTPSEIIDTRGDVAEPRLGSQLNVDVVPDLDGPVQDSDAAVDFRRNAPVHKPKRRAIRLRIVLPLLVIAGLAVYAGASMVGKTAADKEREARIHFLQGVGLVKQLRCGDANVMFDAVLQALPEHTRAKEYRAHCVSEIAAWKVIEKAKQLAVTADYAGALARLQTVDAASGYTPEAKRLIDLYQREIAAAKVAQARALYAAGDLEGAVELLREVLKTYPKHAEALALKDAIENLRKPEPPPKKKKAASVPPLMERAVSLYTRGQISSAIDAAEAAGGPAARTYMERLRRVKGLLEDIATAHRRKAGAEIIKLAPTALELDLRIARGKGTVRGRLKNFYADGLYLKGLEAYTRRDYGKAYKMLSQAVKYHSGHRLAETRLAELSRKAQELYYEADRMKSSNPAGARPIFREVVQMTGSNNRFHKWSSQWLARNGG